MIQQPEFPGSDFLSPSLTRLLETAQREIDWHVNDNGFVWSVVTHGRVSERCWQASRFQHCEGRTVLSARRTRHEAW